MVDARSVSVGDAQKVGLLTDMLIFFLKQTYTWNTRRYSYKYRYFQDDHSFILPTAAARPSVVMPGETTDTSNTTGTTVP